jgi:type I restriction enzyme, S subunit
MNNETLGKHFDLAFSAPNGVQKLRELILTFAMQGKLVPQDPNDQPASELLKDIEIEKQQLIREGKIKPLKLLPKITLEETFYSLPKGWEWVRLGEIIVFTNGYAFKSNLFQKTGIGIIKIGDISNGIVVKDRMDFIDGSYLEEVDAKFQVKFNDMIIAMSGATTGKIGFNKLQEVFLLNQRVGKIEPILADKAFLFNFLSTQIQRNLAISSGSAIPNLSTEQINEIVIPLPPIKEQHRIVAKIDRLMAQCDELENLGGDRNQKRITIHTAAINRLLTAQENSDFSTAWGFIQQHFSELYSVKENVAELRKAILQLAVMGKLVPQDPNDEPASELLRAIETEKKRLVKEGKINQLRLTPSIKSEETIHKLPQGWAWERLGNFGYLLGGGTPSKAVSNYWNGEIPWVSPKDMKVSHIADSQDHVSELALNKSPIKLIPEKSLLIVVRGMILAHSFPTAITISLLTINQDMKALCPYVSSTTSYLFLLTKGSKDRFLSLVKRSSHGTCRLETDTLFSTVLAIPPLAEQQRIVAKVDQLMTLCDELEKQIDAATDKRTELLNALMAQV